MYRPVMVGGLAVSPCDGGWWVDWRYSPVMVGGLAVSPCDGGWTGRIAL